MIGDIERGVPERDDGVADIFVDRGFGAKQHVGRRGEEIVEQLGELIRRQLFRDRGEVADVGEKDGQLAQLAAEG